MNRHTTSASRAFWATTILVVALSLFMGLIQWTGLAELSSRAVRSSPWWNIVAQAFLPWLPWLVVAPAVAYLALRYRIGVGKTRVRLGSHLVIGFVLAGSITLVLHWVEPIVFERIGQPYFVMTEITMPVGKNLFSLQGDGFINANAIPPEIMEQLLTRLPEPVHAPDNPIFFDQPRTMVAPVLKGLVTYSMFIVIINGLLFYHDLRSREATAVQLEAELVRTQLQTLRGQIQPHFLFNTLSSIKTLMAGDVKTAEHVITRLADLLRASLRDLQENEVALSQELAFIRSYLEIEQVRFGPALSVVFDIEAGTEHCHVPTFCLQPLVENAIKHGVGSRASLGEIRISASCRGDMLCIKVADDGPGLPSDTPPMSPGIGLGNTRSRIEHLYGQHGSMDIDAPSGGGFCVRLNIPCKNACGRAPETAR